MKHKKLLALLLILLLGLGLLTGCGAQDALDTAAEVLDALEEAAATPEASALPEATANLETAPPSTAPPPTAPETEAPAPVPTPGETPFPDPTPEAPAVTEDGEYTDLHSVELYLRTYGHLPGNFITKQEARNLGWSGGDLWRYAPGKSIGGDRFGNYEGLLPEGTTYRECDVNYAGGSRGPERIVYGADGSIYYTKDHYASFTRLYGGEAEI